MEREGREGREERDERGREGEMRSGEMEREREGGREGR
jgi:hypothetical protein